MWKESYKIGIELIDNQHFELFQMVEKLLCTIEKEETKENKQEYIEAISFMKDYVMKHFKDEEEYQESIHYKDIQNHKRAHRIFTQTILEYQKKFNETNYDKKEVKNFAGVLTTWLIYHVTDADQKIVDPKNSSLESKTEFSFMNCFYDVVKDVFFKMANVNSDNINKTDIWNHYISGDIFIEMSLLGDIKNSILFAFSEELAYNLIKHMVFVEVKELDEFVISALSEISNIITGNVLTQLSERNINCNMKTPFVIKEKRLNTAIGGIAIDTGIGKLQIAMKNEMFLL